MMTFVAVGNNGSFVACQDCLGSDNDITIIAGTRLHAPIVATTNFWKSLNFSAPSLPACLQQSLVDIENKRTKKIKYLRNIGWFYWENYVGRIDNQDMLMFMVKSVSPVSSVVVIELLLSPRLQFIRIFPLCLCINQQ